MIPRTEIIALKMESSINELKNTFIDTSLSRILIYKDNVENIIGFVHHSDLFDSPEKIHEILHPVIIVSETLEAHELLKKFIHERKSMAVVVDEFGGVAGIATLEDIVEEIFGEIKDEFDNEDGKEVEIGPNHYRFSARLEIDYLNEKYNFNLDEGEYNTLGGFIIYFAERIPQVDEVIRHENLEFTIKSMEGARILEVDLKIYQ
jgi:CBS domain containing-hemolysin-like protein